MFIENGLKDKIGLNKVIESELINSISQLSKIPKFENDVINIINNLLQNINDDNKTNLKQKCILLNYLIKIAKTQSLIQLISFRIINLLNSNESSIPNELLLQSISSLFNTLPISYNTQTISKKFIPILISHVFENNNGSINNTQVIYIGQILRRLTVGLNDSISEIFVLEMFNIFHQILSIDKFEIAHVEKHLILLDDINYESNVSINYLPLLFSVIQGLDNDVKIVGKYQIDLVSIIKNTINILVNEKTIDNITKIQLFVGISVIINKYFNWEQVCQIYKEDESSNDNNNDIKNEIKVWCLYGLIIKGDMLSIESFFDLLDNLNFKQCTKAIKIIFTPIKEVFDEDDKIGENDGLNIDVDLLCAYKKEKLSISMIRSKNRLSISNLILRNMWKQKVLEALLKRGNNDIESNKMKYVLPLVLTYLPEELYKSHLKDLLPGLIKTIYSCDDSKVIISILMIIINVIGEENGRNIVKPYTETIIEICLNMIDSKNTKSKELKIQSLKCLLRISLFDLPTIVPYKKKVVRAAEEMLNDKSRDVRLNAVSVRQAWEDLGIDLSM